jgi:hypothetical protein
VVRFERFLAALAGLLGAGGVALAAAAAHVAQGSSLDSAALIALVHAPTILAGLAGLRSGVLHRRMGLLAIAGLGLGTVLFSGDLAIRVFAGHSLFPMAAPSGGLILIGAWLLLGLSGIFARQHR